jgi:hypothetical protein
MKTTRFRVLFGTLAAAALTAVAACGRADAPTQSAPTPVVATAEISPDSAQKLLGGLGDLVGGVLTQPNLGLLSCPTPSYGSVTKTIGREGGVIVVGPHSLVIPSGALAKDVRITATAPKGNGVRVDFEPHGLRFERSTALTLSYRHCLLGPLSPSIVYVDGRLRILEVIPSVGSLLTKQVTGKVDHFSGYMVAD